MQWNSSYQESIFSFANNINTHEGGSHLSGFRSALTRTLNRYAREKGLLKEKDDEPRRRGRARGPDRGDLGQAADPQFEGQTKTKLGNPGMQGFVESIVNSGLAEFLEENPREAQARSSTRPCRRSRAREAARKARDLTRRKSALENSTPARASSPTARSRTRRWPSSSSSRATPPAARPSRAATATRRRCCRCAARSSTSRRAGSTRSSRTHEIQALITAIGTGDPRRVRHREGPLPQDHPDDRRRRRRRAHPHARAHAAVPRDARADRRRATSTSPSRRSTSSRRAAASATSRRSPSSRRSCSATSRRSSRVFDRHGTQFKLTEARWQRFARLLKQYEGWASALRAEHGHGHRDVPRGVPDPRRGGRRPPRRCSSCCAAPAPEDEPLRRRADRTTSPIEIVVRAVERKTGLAPHAPPRRGRCSSRTSTASSCASTRSCVELAGTPPFKVAPRRRTRARRCRSRSCAARCSPSRRRASSCSASRASAR